MAAAATQIFAPEFDAVFSKYSPTLRARLERKLDDLGLRLESYPHYRMTGSSAYRLRVGDYRLIYRFDLEKNELFVAAVGHRREIYR